MLAALKGKNGGLLRAPGAAKHAAGGGAGDGAPGAGPPKERDENMAVTADGADPNAPAY